MNKLELAHEYAMTILSDPEYDEKLETLIKYSWIYADAMQAEADKRIDKSLPDVLKVHDSSDFQPDWNVAPNWAVAWSLDSKNALWWSDIPKIERNMWFIDDGLWECGEAPTFNYNGNWQDSLRKRPE